MFHRLVQQIALSRKLGLSNKYIAYGYSKTIDDGTSLANGLVGARSNAPARLAESLFRIEKFSAAPPQLLKDVGS